MQNVIQFPHKPKVTASRLTVLPARYTRDTEQARAIRYMQENGYMVEFTPYIIKFSKNGLSWETHLRFTMEHARKIVEFG